MSKLATFMIGFVLSLLTVAALVQWAVPVDWRMATIGIWFGGMGIWLAAAVGLAVAEEYP